MTIFKSVLTLYLAVLLCPIITSQETDTQCEPLLLCLAKSDTQIKDIFTLDYACPNLELFKECRNKYLSNCKSLKDVMYTFITTIDTVCNNPACVKEFSLCSNDFTTVFNDNTYEKVNQLCGKFQYMKNCLLTNTTSCPNTLRSITINAITSINQIACSSKVNECITSTLICLPKGLLSMGNFSLKTTCKNKVVDNCLEKIDSSDCDYARTILEYKKDFCSCSSKLQDCEDEDIMKNVNSDINGMGVIMNMQNVTQSYDGVNGMCRAISSQNECFQSMDAQCPYGIYSSFKIAISAIEQQCKQQECTDSYTKCSIRSVQIIMEHINKGFNIKDLGTDILADYCTNLEEINTCIQNTQSHCTKNMYNSYVTTYDWITNMCALEPCLTDIKNCINGAASIRLDVNQPFMYMNPNDICTNMANSESCIDNSRCSLAVKENLSMLISKAKSYCNYTECIGVVEKCSNTSMNVLMQAVDGVNIENLGLDVISKLCENYEKLSGCMDTQTQYCPSKLVNTWKSVLLQLETTCNSLPCLAKLMECSGPAMEVIASAINEPIKFNTELPQLLGRLCQSIDKISYCLQHVKDECPSNLIKNMNSTLISLKPECFNQACMQEINKCGQNSIIYAFSNKTFTSISENICQESIKSLQCLENNKYCTDNFTEVITSEVSKFAETCHMYAECIDYITKCAGEDLASLMRSITSGNVYAASYDICKISESAMKCLEDALPCQGSIKEQTRSYIAMLEPSCMITACSMEIQKCYGTFNTGSIMEDMSANKYMEACNSLYNITECVKNTINCPHETITYYTGDLNRYVGYCKQYGNCITDVKKCAGDSVNVFMKATGAILKYPYELCTSAVNITKCFAYEKTCMSYLYNGLYKAVDTMNAGCNAIGCVSNIVECSAQMMQVIYNPTLESVYNFCSDHEEFEMCLQKVDSSCAGTTRSSTNFIRSALKVCPYIGCIPRVNNCYAILYYMFSSGTNYDVNSLTKLCSKKEDIKTCMDTQHSDSPSCPKDFTQTWKNTATSLLQSCDIKECAMEIKECGTEIFSGIDFMKMTKEKLIKICIELYEVNTCVKKIPITCPTYLLQGWSSVFKFLNERCAPLLPSTTKDPNESTTYYVSSTTVEVTTSLGSTPSPKTTGNAVVISIRLDLKWSDELTDTSHAKYIDTSRIILDALTNVYKETNFFKEVLIVKLFKSSIGVIHKVVYTKDLSSSEVDGITNTISDSKLLLINGKSVNILESPEIVFENRNVTVDDPCYNYVSRDVCMNGGQCEFNKDRQPRCVCSTDYRGIYCETPNAANSIQLASACIATSLASLIYIYY